MADEENDEPKKRGGLIKIIAMVLGGLLLVGAGVGAGYVLFGSQAPSPSEEIEDIIDKKMGLKVQTRWPRKSRLSKPLLRLISNFRVRLRPT